VSPSERGAHGVLRRRWVTPTIEVYIGKETNKLEEAEGGLIHNLSKILDVYADFRRGPWERLVRPVLKDIPARWLEERTGLSRRTIQRLRNGHATPHARHRDALSRAAGTWARHSLRAAGTPLPASGFAALGAYRKSRAPNEG
jgi:hypothetical protein